MPKSHISRLPWPWYCGIQLIVHAGLQQPHLINIPISYSIAMHTQLSNRHIHDLNLSKRLGEVTYFKSPLDQIKVPIVHFIKSTSKGHTPFVDHGYRQGKVWTKP